MSRGKYLDHCLHCGWNRGRVNKRGAIVPGWLHTFSPRHVKRSLVYRLKYAWAEWRNKHDDRCWTDYVLWFTYGNDTPYPPRQPYLCMKDVRENGACLCGKFARVDSMGIITKVQRVADLEVQGAAALGQVAQEMPDGQGEGRGER